MGNGTRLGYLNDNSQLAQLLCHSSKQFFKVERVISRDPSNHVKTRLWWVAAGSAAVVRAVHNLSTSFCVVLLNLELQYSITIILNALNNVHRFYQNYVEERRWVSLETFAQQTKYDAERLRAMSSLRVERLFTGVI